MKNLQMAVAALVISVSGIQAQTGLYVGVGGGYGFAAARNDLGSDQTTSGTGSSSSTEIKSRSISYGTGVNLLLYGGYMFNENIGAELGFNTLFGSWYEVKNQSPNSMFTTRTRGSGFRLIPALKLVAPVGNHRLYMRAGPIIGLGMLIVNDLRSENSGGGSTSISEQSWEYTGGLSLGFHGATGFMIRMGEKLGIFMEVAGYFQSWSPNNAALTKYNVNGEDRILTLNKRDRETVYEDSYTTSGSSNTPDAPDKESRVWLPFSSIGLNLGVQIHF